MSLLKDLVNEMAAGGSTGGGAVAATPGSLFGGGVVDLKKEKMKKRRVMRRAMHMNAESVVYIKPQVPWTFIKEAIVARDAEDESNFDPTDVISKIDAAEQSADSEEDVTTFGLEDEEGNIIKVRVRADQAEDFEATLSAMLAGQDTDDDNDNSQMEIAEVLYDLKDKFEIVDVEWGKIEGDEEEEQTVAGEEGAEGDELDIEGGGENELGIEGGEGEGGEGEDELDMEADAEMGGDETEAASALTQVIDMMKADADAKKAEANAKEAEARAKEAEYATKASVAKVKQEEETLEMEAYNDGKKKEEDEAKRLAKLAQYQHDKANKAESMLASESTNTPHIIKETSLDEMAKWLLDHLKHQN